MDSNLSREANKREAQKVTLIGAVLDTALGFAKILVGFMANSSALVADGIHSFSDLATDLMVLLIFNISHKEPDHNHPWGHARFETIGTAALGAILMAVAGAMAYESLINLFSPANSTPGWGAIVVALLSVLSKEWIFRYTLAAGKRLKSDLLIANAWHSRTDAISSVIVLFSVLMAMLGFTWIDSLAAVAVALFVGKIGWDLTWNSTKELVDTALPEEQTTKYRSLVESLDGVVDVHSFKSRTMGNQTLLEMHIQVAPYCSASEGHNIGDEAVRRLVAADPDIGHIIYHIDTYNDGEELPDTDNHLPQRTAVEEALFSQLQELAPEASAAHITLHYIHNRIEIELALKANANTPAKELEQALNSALSSHPWFGKLNLWLAAT